jgi:hypothetical protein
MKRIDMDDFNERETEMLAREDILRLPKSRQANLATKFEDLLGDGGPPNETADEMIRAIRQWRDVPSTRSFTLR